MVFQEVKRGAEFVQQQTAADPRAFDK